MKRCNKCNVNQRNGAYYKDKSTQDGMTRDCKTCRLSEVTAYNQRRWAADPWLYLLNQKRRTAKHAGVEFTLTEAWLREAVTKACPYTGIPFRFTEPGTSGSGWSDKNMSGPTFDRIDSDGGYTPENTEIVSWRYNQFKRELHPETLEWMCRVILDKLDEGSEDSLMLREARGL